MTYIGIDPGLHTGVAMWDSTTQKFTLLQTMTFWDVVELVESYSVAEIMIVIEDPNLNKQTFDHGTGHRRKRERISQNVGSNKREASLLIERFAREGYLVEVLAPLTRRTKAALLNVPPSTLNKAKVPANVFKVATGYAKRTSEHARDAAMLIYKR